MPVAVNQPREKESDLDQILKGLKIAESAYGIYDAGKRREAIEKQNEEERKKREEKDAYEKDVAEKNEQLSLMKDYNILPPEQANPNAIAYTNLRGEQLSLLPKDKPLSPELAYRMQRDRVEDSRKAKEVAAAPKLTQDQTNAALFATRAANADQNLADIKAQGFDRTSRAEGMLSLLPNALQSGPAKQQRQAELNFLTAVLRKESGASISPTEMDNAETVYFPRSGDDENVLAQKAQARADAIAGLSSAAGPGMAAIQKQAIAQKPPQEPGTAQAAPQLSAEDQQALAWIRDPKNKNSPYFEKNRQKLLLKGVQGI